MCEVYHVTYKIKLFDLFSKSLKTEETEKLTNLLAGIATKKQDCENWLKSERNVIDFNCMKYPQMRDNNNRSTRSNN